MLRRGNPVTGFSSGCQDLVRFFALLRINHMLHRLCGSPSIPLSFILANVLPRWIAYCVSCGTDAVSYTHLPVFLLNSCLSLFSAACARRHPFSRSYGVILPSSLTMLLPPALGFSPHPPVSVYGTGCLLYTSKKRQNVNFYSVHTKKTRVQICYALGSDSLNMFVFYIIFCTPGGKGLL